MNSNLQSPRGVRSGFRKQKKGTPFLPYPKPELKVLMMRQSASVGRGNKFQAQFSPRSKESRTGSTYI